EPATDMTPGDDEMDDEAIRQAHYERPTADPRNLIKNTLAHEFIKQAEARGVWDHPARATARQQKLMLESLLAAFLHHNSAQKAGAELEARRPVRSGKGFAR